MLMMNRPMFAQELRRGSSGISDAHIDRTFALMTPRMKKQVLRLYRASDPANFKPWENDFLALTRRKPTLAIWGDKDPYVSPRFAERFNAKKVVHLPHAGHWAPVEAPAECADAILQFFSEAG
jgi:pimeloyl-ACP methyl ester carboxylesterase